MSNNTQVVGPGTGDNIRTIDRSVDNPAIPAKTQVLQLDAGGENVESLVTAGNPLPTFDTSTNNLIMMILIEMRIQSAMQYEEFGRRFFKEDLDAMRANEAQIVNPPMGQ